MLEFIMENLEWVLTVVVAALAPAVYGIALKYVGKTETKKDDRILENIKEGYMAIVNLYKKLKGQNPESKK